MIKSHRAPRSGTQEVAMKFAGKVLEYEYVNREVYRLRFGNNSITWECLADSAAGASVTESSDAVEIAPNVLFISWFDDNGELVRIVANLEKKILHCTHVYQGTRLFWRGTIRYFGPGELM